MPRKPTLSTYKACLRPHLDCCDVIYDKPHNEKFIDTLESIQYNTTLPITYTFEGTKKHCTMNSVEKISWMRRLCLFHKILNLKSPKYLYDLVPLVIRSYAIEIIQMSHLLNCRKE